jgi:hypothetical protein
VQGDADESLFVTGNHNVINVSRSHPAPQPGPPSPLHQLPADIADFAGRGAQVEKLLGVLSAPGGRGPRSARSTAWAGSARRRWRCMWRIA